MTRSIWGLFILSILVASVRAEDPSARRGKPATPSSTAPYAKIDKPSTVNIAADLAPQWTEKFNGKSGWIGGDGAYSAALPADRVLWLFGDTILGVVREGHRREAVMVNNTIAIQEGRHHDAPIHFLSGVPRDGKPGSFFIPADGTGWFWPQAGIYSGGKLYIFLPQIAKSGDGGAMGFKQIGQWLAIIDNPADAPEQWRIMQRKLPWARFSPDGDCSWGSAVLAEGNDIYIYGFEEKEKALGHKRLIVARAPADKIEDFTAWRFNTPTGWSDKPEESSPLVAGLAAEFSVSPRPDGKGLILVYTENGLSDRIIGRFATGPAGPWSAPTLLYKSPEMSQDKGLFSYAGKAHPWAATGDDLLITYCVNAWKFGRVFEDQSVYRPAIVMVHLPSQADAARP